MSRTTLPAGPVSLCRPEWLYQVLVDYAGFGAHLTGSEADRATADWLMRLIGEIGGSARAERFAFDRFDARAELVADGRAVPSVPLFYSATGSFDTDDVQVVRFDSGLAGSAPAFEERLSGLDSRAAVIACWTFGHADLPAIACRCSAIGSQHPTKLLEGLAWPRVDGRGVCRCLWGRQKSVGVLVMLVSTVCRAIGESVLHGDGAVDGPDDLPVQCNRFPTKLLSVPGVIVPGNWFERLRNAQLRLRFDGSIEPATSANVLATFGHADLPAIAVTTPLTGWTPAAGERGTGLAAALAIAVELSTGYSVHFSACSGHEIDHIGLRHHLSQRDVRGTPAVHFGASVGAVEPGVSGALELTSTRMSLTTAMGPCRSDIAGLAAGANWILRDVDPPWPGEGGTWQEAGAAVLSFLGSSPLFHTAHDTPERATTPEALHLATTVALNAARRFLEDAKR